MRVAVVIPTLNEAINLPRALDSLDAQHSPADRVIVADGGSTDATPAIARRRATLVSSPEGRARQMNAGAAAAADVDVLLFLHADTTLDPHALAELRAAMRDARCVAAAFRLRIDAPARTFRAVEFGVRARCRLAGLPYGDQALAVRASAFARLGGFRDLPIMEDADLVLRLRPVGRLALLRAAATTSARRWHKHGVLRVTAANAAAIAMFRAGVPPAAIRRAYARLAGGAARRPRDLSPPSLTPQPS